MSHASAAVGSITGSGQFGYPIQIARDDWLACARFCGSRTDGILGVRPAQDQGAANDGVIDRGHGEDTDQPFNTVPSKCRVTCSLEQVGLTRSTRKAAITVWVSQSLQGVWS